MEPNNEGATGSRSGQQGYPEDRFDRVERSGRVGAHRVIARPRYVWQYVIAGLLGFALLTGVGVMLVTSAGNLGSVGERPEETTTTEATPDAVIDPDATIAVLNGTETDGLEVEVDRIITAEQWGKILFSGKAENSDVTISAVFYTDEADLAAAAGLAAELGGISTYQTDGYQEYDAQLVVLLGSDYAGPGLEEAQARGAEEETPEPEPEPQINPVTGYQIDPETGNDIDPATGLLIDPATGLLIDEATGYLIDPATGLPIDPATGLPIYPAG